MRRIPLRWALPIFHLAMDALLVAAFVVTLRYGSPVVARFRTGPFLPVAYDPNVTMVIDPLSRGLPGSPGLVLLITANPPAGIITLLGLSTTGHDIYIPDNSGAFLWLAFYEFLALPFWCLMSRVPSAYWWCIASMIVRFVAFSVGFSRLAWTGPALQATFWLIVAICAIGAGLWQLTKCVRTHLRSAA